MLELPPYIFGGGQPCKWYNNNILSKSSGTKACGGKTADDPRAFWTKESGGKLFDLVWE